MGKDVFKGAGTTIVMEEFLEGVEASILSITDGEVIIPFISSKDHKQLLDGDKGPNTGGMGVIAPNPYCTKEVLMEDRKSTRLNSSHANISYAVFCLKKKKNSYLDNIYT